MSCVQTKDQILSNEASDFIKEAMNKVNELGLAGILYIDYYPGTLNRKEKIELNFEGLQKQNENDSVCIKVEVYE